MESSHSDIPTTPALLFRVCESAVDAFLREGGYTVKVLRCPRHWLEPHSADFVGLQTYTHGVRIEEAPQDRVSVRGTTIAGHDFEWPQPNS